MKKQKILALVLGTIIGISNLLMGGMAYANESDNQNNSNDYTIEISEKSFEDELLKNSVLNKKELEIYNKATDNIMKLYENLEEIDLSDAILNKLKKDEDKIYADNKEIFDKVTEYFNDLENAPHNKEANYSDDQVNSKLADEEFYNELLENKVLNSNEIDLLKEAENKLNSLYEKDLDSFDEDTLIKQENDIYKNYKTIFDKIDEYYDNMIENTLQ